MLEDNDIRKILDWSDHPVLQIPTKDQIVAEGWTTQKIFDYHKSREEAIAAEIDDPYRYGMDLSNWRKADNLIKQGVVDLLIQGGNRSAKTEYCAKRVVQAAMHNPNSIIWCFQTTYENSIQMQQKAIWKYIPREFREKNIRSQVTYISYTQKRGFSDGKLVFPNGSEIVFRNYSQDIVTIEGGEIGCMKPAKDIDYVHNIGFWADELIPQDFLDTLRFRLITRNAIGLISFTAIQGYTPVVREYMSGAITEECKRAELLDDWEVPVVQQPKRKSSKIIYFHTKDNPYNNYQRLKDDLDGAPREEILCRAYGVPEKPLAGKFPKFSHKYNVITPENIPWIKDPDQKVTQYMVIDPAGDKPWFMIWAGVTPMGEVYIWDEYPNAAIEGAWADMSKGKKGRPGPGAKGNGFGFQDYKTIMEDVEKGMTIFERLIDPRMGATKYQKEDMTTDIINELSLIDIHTIPAPGYDENVGLQSINDLLSWDDTKPFDLHNKPKLYISEKCENLIYAMTEYTGELGGKEPTKDPIDCLRYLCIADVQFLDESSAHFVANR